MIVEFCGVPGAGKSTVAAALVDELVARGHMATSMLGDVSPSTPRPRRVARKLGYAVWEFGAHPRSSFRAVQLLSRSGQPGWRDVAVRAVNWLVVRSAYRRARDSAVVGVIDQGLIQELCSVGFRGRAVDALDLGDPGPDRLAPDRIVQVDVDVRIAGERLAGRPGRQSRVETPGLDILDELDRQSRLLAEVLPAWLDRYGDARRTTVHRFANDRDGADVHRLISNLDLESGPQPHQGRVA